MDADLLVALGIGLSALGMPQKPTGADHSALEAAPISVEYLAMGAGLAAGTGDRVTVHFVVRTAAGRELANSMKRGMPFTLVLDEPGSFWTTAIDGLREGGKSRLRANTSIFFGKYGVLPVIPADTEIEAEMTLLKVQKAELARKG